MALLLLGLALHKEERNDFTLNGRDKKGREDPERKGQTIVAGLHILTITAFQNFLAVFKLKHSMLNVVDVRVSDSRRRATY